MQTYTPSRNYASNHGLTRLICSGTLVPLLHPKVHLLGRGRMRESFNGETLILIPSQSLSNLLLRALFVAYPAGRKILQQTSLLLSSLPFFVSVLSLMPEHHGLRRLLSSVSLRSKLSWFRLLRRDYFLLFMSSFFRTRKTRLGGCFEVFRAICSVGWREAIEEPDQFGKAWTEAGINRGRRGCKLKTEDVTNNVDNFNLFQSSLAGAVLHYAVESPPNLLLE